MQSIRRRRSNLDEESTDGCSVTSEKSYYCTASQCGKIFKFKSQLQRHLMIHSSEKPFACSFAGCTKAFKRKDAVTNHMKVHSSRESFKCSIPGCSSFFSTKSACNYHIKKHDLKSALQSSAESYTSLDSKEHYRQEDLFSSPSDQSFLFNKDKSEFSVSDFYHSSYSRNLRDEDSAMNIDFLNYDKVQNALNIELDDSLTVGYMEAHLSTLKCKDMPFKEVSKEVYSVKVNNNPLQKLLSTLLKENENLKERLRDVESKVLNNFSRNDQRVDDGYSVFEPTSIVTNSGEDI